jgi:hypothetical protein
VDAIGLINPPTVIPQEAGGYRIICGFRRIAACHQCGMDRIVVRIMPENIDPMTCTVMAAADNALQRPLNIIEQSRACRLLLLHCQDGSKLARTARQLGLPANAGVIRQLAEVSNFDVTIQDGLHAGHLSLGMALELSTMQPADGNALARLFQELPMGLNRQRQVLNFLREISIRDDMTIAELLTTAPVAEVLNHPQWDTVNKALELGRYLKTQRFPHLTQFQKQFESNCKALKLGSHIRLNAPRDFESAEYTLLIRFDSPQALQRHLEAINQVRQSNLFKQLFELI